jgi:hypothetical protein
VPEPLQLALVPPNESFGEGWPGRGSFALIPATANSGEKVADTRSGGGRCCVGCGMLMQKQALALPSPSAFTGEVETFLHEPPNERCTMAERRSDFGGMKITFPPVSAHNHVVDPAANQPNLIQQTITLVCFALCRQVHWREIVVISAGCAGCAHMQQSSSKQLTCLT